MQSKYKVIISQTLFQPKFPPRAKLNIYISDEFTRHLLHNIEEKFDDEQQAYYYLDMSVALQINDKQMQVFTISQASGTKRQVSFINLDLHFSNTTETVYAVVVPNTKHNNKEGKWQWKMQCYMTAEQICAQYKITADALPKSSRAQHNFKTQLQQHTDTIDIDEVIKTTDLLNVETIRSLKDDVGARPKLCMPSTDFFAALKNAWHNNIPLIPVLITKDNNHWIEWIKLVNVLTTGNMFIGVAFKHDQPTNKWLISTICLDKGDIYNKNKLIGDFKQCEEYKKQLEIIQVSLLELVFDAEELVLKSQLLKDQIKAQQISIEKYKYKNNKLMAENSRLTSLLKEKTSKPRGGVAHNAVNKPDIDNKLVYYKDFVRCHHQSDDTLIDECVDFALDDQKMDDPETTSKYKISPFRCDPVGAKRSIYIDQSLTNQWVSLISFPHHLSTPDLLYYWMDYTAAIQMLDQDYSCLQYKQATYDPQHNITELQFKLAIINFELYNLNKQLLYGIVKTYDGDKGKMPYVLQVLATREEIQKYYGIQRLPHGSRRNPRLANSLKIARRLESRDIVGITWRALKFCQSRSSNNNQAKQSAIMHNRTMDEYTELSLEKLYQGKQQGMRYNELLPILVIDKKDGKFAIDWLLKVRIIHKNLDIGVSFSYNKHTDNFEAKAIYGDKGEIATKHLLVGLENNACSKWSNFSFSRCKFVNNNHVIKDAIDHGHIQHVHEQQLRTLATQQQLNSVQPALPNITPQQQALASQQLLAQQMQARAAIDQQQQQQVTPQQQALASQQLLAQQTQARPNDQQQRAPARRLMIAQIHQLRQLNILNQRYNQELEQQRILNRRYNQELDQQRANKPRRPHTPPSS